VKPISKLQASMLDDLAKPCLLLSITMLSGCAGIIADNNVVVKKRRKKPEAEVVSEE